MLDIGQKEKNPQNPEFHSCHWVYKAKSRNLKTAMLKIDRIQDSTCVCVERGLTERTYTFQVGRAV